jgi:hypothetical protein
MTSVSCRSAVFIGWAIAVAACANENPPPQTASTASRTEAQVATAKAKGEAERAPSVAAPSETQAKPSGAQSQEMRYGPKVHALPEGCGPAGEKFSCNPLTNAGCRGAEGEVCDDDEHDAFGCDPESDNVKEGGDCNDKDGPSCAAGLTCNTPSESEPRGICRKYCCTKADCSAPTKCVVLDKEFGTLGVCK